MGPTHEYFNRARNAMNLEEHSRIHRGWTDRLESVVLLFIPIEEWTEEDEHVKGKPKGGS